MWTDLNQVVVRTVEVFVQLNHQALKKRRELLFLLPRLWNRERGGQLTSKIRHIKHHTHTHTHTHTQKQTLVDLSLLSAEISVIKTTTGRVRSDGRYSQGPLPSSSTRNICGFWNFNAPYCCEMMALTWTAENMRAFWMEACGKKHKGKIILLLTLRWQHSKCVESIITECDCRPKVSHVHSKRDDYDLRFFLDSHCGSVIFKVKFIFAFRLTALGN